MVGAILFRFQPLTALKYKMFWGLLIELQNLMDGGTTASLNWEDKFVPV